VPITAQRRPARVSACAIHWLQLVLPFVPVMPTIHSLPLGPPWKRAAISPAWRRRSGHATFGTRHAERQRNPRLSHST
jgi:hypothetical protein